MNTATNKSEETEPVCGLTAETAKKMSASRSQQKCSGSCQLKTMAEHGNDEKRKPGKRNGCIGNWLDRMAKANRDVFGSPSLKCNCGK